MGLRVQQFFQFQPKISNKFFVEVKGKEDFGFFVQKVVLPVFEEGDGDNAIYLGNGVIRIPIFSPGKRTLQITFEETDEMDILKWLDDLMKAGYDGNPLTVEITVIEYDVNMIKIVHHNTFKCRLKDYDEPSFSMSGGVQAITINATFLVDLNNGLTEQQLAKKNQENQVKAPEETQKPKEVKAPVAEIVPSKPVVERKRLSEEEKKQIKKKIKNKKLSVKEYLDYKYTLEQELKEKIEKDIEQNGENSVYTKHEVNGQVFYTVKSNRSGKSYNRDGGLSGELDDIMLHTIGTGLAASENNLFDALNKGTSMVLYGDFAVVKEEVWDKGRVHSATTGDDYMAAGTANSMLSIERNLFSGLGKTRRGYYASDLKGKIYFTDTDVEAAFATEGITLFDTFKGSDKKKSAGFMQSEFNTMSAVFSDMNEHGSAKFNFNDAKVIHEDMQDKKLSEIRAAKIQKNDLAGGTRIGFHDMVSSSDKNGEGSIGQSNELIKEMSNRGVGPKSK